MPTGAQYLALLRGINVGGKNLVRMADLREAFGHLDDRLLYGALGQAALRLLRPGALSIKR
jgi:hypothetical protein